MPAPTHDQPAHNLPYALTSFIGRSREMAALTNHLAEAVQLFLARARAVQPDFDLTAENAADIVQICAQLDGLPLALELAAARLALLTPAEIATRLHDRFALLSGGGRTALPRHQTLQALVDWSYEMLAESERVLLARLSVFSGGWTLEAAEAVVSDPSTVPVENVLDLLAQLASKSLIIVEWQPETETHYTIF